MTVLTRWTTPLVARMSKAITPASPALDLMVMYLFRLTLISSPPAVATSVTPIGTSRALRAAPGTTWRSRTAVRASLSSSSAASASAGTLAKASLVGARGGLGLVVTAGGGSGEQEAGQE